MSKTQQLLNLSWTKSVALIFNRSKNKNKIIEDVTQLKYQKFNFIQNQIELGILVHDFTKTSTPT